LQLVGGNAVEQRFEESYNHCLEVPGIVGTDLYCLPEAPITAHTDSMKYYVIPNASPDHSLSPECHWPFLSIAS
jgi:hypothetical protein